METDQRTLVLTAFPAEADAILARTTLAGSQVVVVNGRHYYLGIFGGKKVIVAMTGIGMVNAADTVEAALAHFTPQSGILVRAVVFAGVAGGSGRTRIGDVAIPARWTADTGTTWHAVDPEMLAAADDLAVELESACLVDLKREPRLHVGGDGASGDNNNGVSFPTIPFGGAVFGPQPRTAPDFSRLFAGNFFEAMGPFLVRGVISNIRGS